MQNFEGMASLGFFSITTSGFLAAYALALGANNLQVGILAAIPFITQPLQIPIILLVEYLKRRKVIAVPSWFLAQLLWVPMALIPVFIDVPSATAISLLIGLMALRGIFGAFVNCSWNSWLRDLIPKEMLGRVFSRRLALSTVVAVVFSLGAAFFVDYWRAHVPGENAVFGYTIMLVFGALFIGLAAPVFMTLTPEPQMQLTAEPKPSLRKTITMPLRDSNFKQLIKFLLFWSFALNLAVPFFAVYMLKRLGMPLIEVIALSVLSQLFNLLFLRVWGTLVDQFGSKVILSVSASLYLLVIIGWTFTTMPEQHVLTLPLLIILHIFAGIATAGVTITVGMIGLKLAPSGRATPYLAGSSLATSIGAGLGPVVGGILADYFSVRQFTINFEWIDPSRVFQWSAISLSGFDFLFAIAFVIGLITLNILIGLREEGEVSREEVLDELMAQTRTVTRAVSSVPGLGFVSQFPFIYLRRIPGLDVAISVTAYQLSDMVKTAILAASKGRRAAQNITKDLENSIVQLSKHEKMTGAQGIELSKHSARGIIHAVEKSTLEREHLLRPAMVGIVRALKRIHVDTNDAFFGTGYGIVQGAVEVEMDITEAAVEAVAGAGDAAKTLGLSPERAMKSTTEGILTAAAAISPEKVDQLRESLLFE